MEKIYETQITIRYLFVNYNAAFDSPIGDSVFAAISELGIKTLSIFCSSAKVGMAFSEPFDALLCFRQADPL